MADALLGYGSDFEISTDSGVNWVGIGEVTEITPPSDTLDVIDVTHMTSPNRTREFLAGLRDPGECSCEINFVPGSAGDVAIQAARDAAEVIMGRITFPNAEVWTFDMILTGYEPSIPLDDKMVATVTFKVTGSYEVAS